MRLSNDLFAQALDWIYANTDVKDQKALAVRTGITETTISRILNDRVKQPSEETIRKLNNAFGCIFNPAYFRGENICLLMKDAAEIYPKENSVSPSEDDPTTQLIEMYAQRVRLVDDLRTSLKNELDEIRALRTELQQARDDFREATYRLTQYVENKLASQQPYTTQIGMAAESDNISPNL